MCNVGADSALHTFPQIQILPQKLLYNMQELLAYEQIQLQDGFEGVMIRNPLGKYKYGRSTQKEAYLLKVKRFIDSESVVIGFEELMHNSNELRTNELGYAKRSSQKDGKIPMGILGALRVRDLESNVEFSIGTGYTAEQRSKLWAEKDNLLNKIVTYKSFKNTGVDIAPRFPVFKSFRDQIDYA
jgi:DNA ligase-1